MKLHVLASGSSGNSYCIETATDLIFVDIGITLKSVRAFIKERADGKTVSLFITHEHTDHVGGIVPFINKFPCKVYCSEGTALCLKEHAVPEDMLYPLRADSYYDMVTFGVLPFDVNHDATEPFGYIVMTEKSNIGFMTDLGCVTDKQLSHLESANMLVLESNHDPEMLKKGKYPPYLKKRIASSRGHLSNKDALLVISKLCASNHTGRNLSHCLLAHVSEENNDYTLLSELGRFCTEQYGIHINILKQREYNCFDIEPLNTYFSGVGGVYD